MRSEDEEYVEEGSDVILGNGPLPPFISPHALNHSMFMYSFDTDYLMGYGVNVVLRRVDMGPPRKYIVQAMYFYANDPVEQLAVAGDMTGADTS